MNDTCGTVLDALKSLADNSLLSQCLLVDKPSDSSDAAELIESRRGYTSGTNASMLCESIDQVTIVRQHRAC